MPKFYVKWWVEQTKIPVDAEERIKLLLSMLEMVKADLKTRVKMDWYMAAGGNFGYSLYEAANEAEVFANLLKYMPYVQFEVVPVLTVDQTIDSMKKAIAAAKR